MLKGFYSYKKCLSRYNNFKDQEHKYDIRIPEGLYIIRFDGKGMTKLYNIPNKAINESFYNVMEETFKEFLKRHRKIKLAYKFSDEISICLNIDENNRLEKILSLYASELSVIFYKTSIEHNFELKYLPTFDARIIPIKNKNMLTNYFFSRQSFCVFQHLERLCSEYNIKLKFKNSNNISAKLKKEGYHYLNEKAGYLFGTLFLYNDFINEEIFRNDQMGEKIMNIFEIK